MGAFGLGHIGNNPAGHFHGHERIAVNVGIGGQPKVFKSFAKIEFAPIRSCRIHPSAGDQAQTSKCYGPSGKVYRTSPISTTHGGDVTSALCDFGKNRVHQLSEFPSWVNRTGFAMARSGPVYPAGNRRIRREGTWHEVAALQPAAREQEPRGR